MTTPLAERERCARLAESYPIDGSYGEAEGGGESWEPSFEQTREGMAAAIRATPPVSSPAPR